MFHCHVSFSSLLFYDPSTTPAPAWHPPFQPRRKGCKPCRRSNETTRESYTTYPEHTRPPGSPDSPVGVCPNWAAHCIEIASRSKQCEDSGMQSDHIPQWSQKSHGPATPIVHGQGTRQRCILPRKPPCSCRPTLQIGKWYWNLSGLKIWDPTSQKMLWSSCSFLKIYNSSDSSPCLHILYIYCQ